LNKYDFKFMNIAIFFRRERNGIRFVGLLSYLLFAPALLLPSNYAYQRYLDITGEIYTDALAAVVLPPEITTKCRPDLADVALFDGEGRDIPFAIDAPGRADLNREWTIDVISNIVTAGSRTSWVLDLGASKTVDNMTVNISEERHFRTLSVEASTDQARWKRAVRDAAIFSGEPLAPGRHDTVAFSRPVSARYLKVSFNDGGQKPLEPQSFVVGASDRISGMRWERTVRIEARRAEEGQSHGYRIVAEPGIAFDRLTLGFDDRKLSREVEVYEKVAFHDPRAEAARLNPQHGVYRRLTTLGVVKEPEFDLVSVGRGWIFRAKLPGTGSRVESHEIVVGPHGSGELWLEIAGNGNQPPGKLSVTASGLSPRLLFVPVGRRCALRYGNPSAEPISRPENIIRKMMAGGTPLLEARLGKILP